jgi:hypothetical protein
MSEPDVITRREALSRTALLLGGALAASTVAGVESSAAWASSARWRARTLSAPQTELVAALAEHIIPTTDTPGARAAGVHRFVDAVLSDYYAAEERARFLAGLADIDARARKAHQKEFLQTTRAQQVALLTALDAESYPPPRVLQRAEPLSSERQVLRDSLARPGSTGATVSDPARAAATAAGSPAMQQGWFFRRMKELTLLGYYTSEIGATRELRVNPMGTYRGDVPYRSIGHSWA